MFKALTLGNTVLKKVENLAMSLLVKKSGFDLARARIIAAQEFQEKGTVPCFKMRRSISKFCKTHADYETAPRGSFERAIFRLMKCTSQGEKLMARDLRDASKIIFSDLSGIPEQFLTRLRELGKTSNGVYERTKLDEMITNIENMTKYANSICYDKTSAKALTSLGIIIIVKAYRVSFEGGHGAHLKMLCELDHLTRAIYLDLSLLLIEHLARNMTSFRLFLENRIEDPSLYELVKDFFNEDMIEYKSDIKLLKKGIFPMYTQAFRSLNIQKVFERMTIDGNWSRMAEILDIRNDHIKSELGKIANLLNEGSTIDSGAALTSLEKRLEDTSMEKLHQEVAIVLAIHQVNDFADQDFYSLYGIACSGAKMVLSSDLSFEAEQILIEEAEIFGEIKSNQQNPFGGRNSVNTTKDALERRERSIRGAVYTH